MDPYSSGEEKITKIRKAYTITKQREKWTEEEHGRFLEALKLYGRAWQRIEEHIGTKNAVQIRSHAQKFFLKLEKDASAKGVPIGQVHDIDIPPPRPKRKPSNPYPRKSGALIPTVELEGEDGKSLTPVSSPPTNQLPDLHNGALQGAGGQEKPIRPYQHENCFDVLNISLAPPCTSLSFNKPQSASTLGMINIPIVNLDSVPVTVKVTHADQTMEEPHQNPDKDDAELIGVGKGLSKPTELEKLQSSPSSANKYINMDDDSSQTYYTEATAESAKSCPTKIPVHAVDISMGTCRQTPHPVLYQLLPPQRSGISINQTLAHFTSLGTPAPTERKPSKEGFPPSHPPSPICSMFTNNEDDYRSYLQFSTAFSNLTVSTLQQNPAAYAAATSAATVFWPNANEEAPREFSGGFPSRIANAGGASPSVAAIAAATVAAATAWWASNGLIPFCAPHPSATHNQSCFSTENNASSSFHTAVPKTVACGKFHRDLGVRYDQQEEAVNCLNFPGKNSAFKPLTSSPEKSDENQVMLNGKQVLLKTSTSTDKSAAVEDLKNQDSSPPTKNMKQVDRSSSGSNTTCSSELEIDALEKHGKEAQESNDPDNVHSIGDSTNRRNRTAANTNDSWKEVSEEGRVAFRALFSREVLPQSFASSRQSVDLATQTECNQDSQPKHYGFTLPLDLNNSQVTESSMKAKPESEVDEQVSIMGPAGKLKSHRTGFKPYKRCSIEGKEIRVLNSCSEDVEKGPKRICLEGREPSP